MHKASEPYGEARSDHEIFRDLSERMGFADAFTEGRDEMGWVRHLYDLSRENAAKAGVVTYPTSTTFWAGGWMRVGPLTTGNHAIAALREDPAANPLTTPSGMVELVSETIGGFGYPDCGRHPMWYEPREWLGGEAALSSPPAPFVRPAARQAAQPTRQRRAQRRAQDRRPRTPADPPRRRGA